MPRKTLYNSTVILTLGLCFIAMLFGLAFGHGTIPWTVGLMSSLPPFMVAWFGARETHLLNPYSLFAAAYGAYNGLLLLRFAFLDPGELPYPLQLTNGSIIAAGVLSALGSASIVIVWLFRGNTVDRTIPTFSSSQLKASFQVGILFAVFAFGLYLAQVEQLGGFTAAISIDRVERFQLMQEGFSFPYVSFASVSVALMILGSANFKSRRYLSWSVVLFWVLVLVLQGDRRLVLQILLTSLAVTAVFNPHRFRVRKATLLVGSFAVILALVFGKIRPLISMYMQGEADAGVFFSQNQALIDPIYLVMPENTEFGGPYVSVLDATSTSRPLLLGRTYLETLPTFLPRALYPGTKPEPLANELADSLSHGDMFVMGWGYSPIAEAYRNFGLFGVAFIMACWGGLFLWVWSIQAKGPWGVVFSATLLQDAIIVNRIDFRTIYLETIFNFTVVLLGLSIAKLYARRLQSREL